MAGADGDTVLIHDRTQIVGVDVPVDKRHQPATIGRIVRPEELDERLIANKVTYLRKILRIGRDRSGAFDYSKPSWNVPGNCSGFQLRVSPRFHKVQ